jgi:hypothetical protein
LAIASTVRWLIATPFTVAAAGPFWAWEASFEAFFAESQPARASIDAAPARRIANLMGLISFLGLLWCPFEISGKTRRSSKNVPTVAPRNP